MKRRLEFWQFRVEFKLQDAWIGAYWKWTGHNLDVWVCLIPCVPLHLCLIYHDPQQ